MKIVGIYSMKGGEQVIQREYYKEYKEVQQVIQRVHAQQCMKKLSREKTKMGRVLYSPSCLNKLFQKEFNELCWERIRVYCEYSEEYYLQGYKPVLSGKRKPYREMDFVKNGLGVEVQLGKYAFMVYNVCAKMTIFHNLGKIKAGIEIVPVKEIADQMSSGVAYFEQFVWDLENRGESNIDIPVLVIGVSI